MSAEQEIRDLNAAYIRASMTSDVSWYARHLADDFTFVNHEAKAFDKPAFLAMIGAGTDQATYVLEEVDIRVYGDAGVVRAVGAWTTHAGVRGKSHYVDVYARIAGHWKAVSAQITRPSLAHEPRDDHGTE